MDMKLLFDVVFLFLAYSTTCAHPGSGICHYNKTISTSKTDDILALGKNLRTWVRIVTNILSCLSGDSFFQNVMRVR